jgi:hypothetical protein
MEALAKIGLPSIELSEAFLPLLRDEDFEVQVEAVKWIGSHDHRSSKIPTALRSLLTAPRCSICVKFRAALILLTKKQDAGLSA